MADEADITIRVNATDVRCSATNAACPGGAGSDYVGNVLLTTAMRLTDRNSGFGGVSATVQDLTLDVPVTCTATVDPAIGSSCDGQHVRRRACAGHDRGGEAHDHVHRAPGAA